MTNRQRLIEVLEQGVSPLLRDELDYFIEVERDEPYDLADALHDVEDSILGSERRLRQEIRGILINVGCYVLAPVKTTVGKDLRFSHKGLKYDFPHAGGWESWLDSSL